MAKDTWVDGYIARDAITGLCFFVLDKPIRKTFKKMKFWGVSLDRCNVKIPLRPDHHLGKGLTWEDEPKPVKFVAVEE